jgi:hypothetical protein
MICHFHARYLRLHDQFHCTIFVNVFVKESAVQFKTSDVVPISEARARLTELADDVFGGGAEKILTKNGSSFVAIVDARKLDYYHALEEEHAGLVLLEEAETGLRQILAGQRVSAGDLIAALS